MKDKIVSLYKQYEEIIHYLIVGGLTTLIATTIKLGLYYSVFDVTNALEAQEGVVISWICAVIFAYVTNRIFVFKSHSTSYLREILSFFGSRLVTLGLESFLTYLFFQLLGLTFGFWKLGVTLLIQILVIVLNYVLSKLLVFTK